MNDYDQFILYWRETSVLGSCSALLGWDERTYMPPAGSRFRADQIALLARLIHERVTHPRIGAWLESLSTGSLNDEQLANVREIRRSYERAIRVPARLVEELARTTTQAQQVWVEARAASDFRRFLPWLEKILL